MSSVLDYFTSHLHASCRENDGLRAQLKEAEEKISVLTKERDQARGIFDPMNRHITDLERQIKEERATHEKKLKAVEDRLENQVRTSTSEIHRLKGHANDLDANFHVAQADLALAGEAMESARKEADEQASRAKAALETVESLKAELTRQVSKATDSVEAAGSMYISMARRHCLLLGVSPDLVAQLHQFVDVERLPVDLEEDQLNPHNPEEEEENATRVEPTSADAEVVDTEAPLAEVTGA